MISLNFPLPLQIVLDDVGWWSGKDDWANNGPFRTGLARDHCVEDYEAIASLGHQLGVKPACGFVVAEWDTKNILREIPSATWMGKNWVNPWNHAPHKAAAKILRDHRGKNLELTLHGIGHEYWLNGKAHRANWHNNDGVMWPADDLRKHLRAYQQILDEHSLGAGPDSFVPCAGRYRFDATGRGLAGLLAEVGVKYNGQPFLVMHRQQPTQHPRFGVEAGVLTIDRGPDMMAWFAIDPQLSFHVDGPICGAHWSNILHPDPRRNEEVVTRWVKHLRPYHDDFCRMLSQSTADAWTQFVYHETAQCWSEGDFLNFDFSALDALPAMPLLDTFHVKVNAPETSTFTSSDLDFDATWDSKLDYFRVKAKRKNKASRGIVRVSTRGAQRL